VLALFFAVAPAAAQPAAKDAAAAEKARRADLREARSAYERAQAAEHNEDWEAAFELFARAASLFPENRDYLYRRERARARLAAQFIQRAELEALSGRLHTARMALEAALQLDPGSSLARERLEQLQPRGLPQVVARAGDERPPKLRTAPGVRSFDIRGDVREVYEKVGKEFGLWAVFDPELRPSTLRFRLEDVNYETALNVLGHQTGTFWRAVDAQTFLVAESTQQKWREYAPTVARSILLAGSSTPEQMAEAVRLVREVVGIGRVQLDSRTRTITLRDTPESVDVAVALLEELEQPIGEMLLDVEILELDRRRARQLGITPPTSGQVFAVTPQDAQDAQTATTTAELLEILQRILGRLPSSTGISAQQLAGLAASGQAALIPPLVAFGGGRTLFFSTLPGAAADFAETFSVVRSARRVLVRAQDGLPATFFVGERLPITLATLGSPIRQTFIPPETLETVFPRTEFAAGERPSAVATGEFNGDSSTDVVVANENSGTVSVFLGNGDGTFAAATDFAVGAAPVAIAVADFNRDAHADLAVVNFASNSVSILMGNGDGTFQPAADFPVGTTPRAIFAGDLDGDNFPDLAVANEGSNNVSILRGAGDGTFATIGEIPVGESPRAILAGNFAGDTALDLAVANHGSDTVSVLLNDGSASFTLAAELATSDAPAALGAGDFNRDGFLDLVTVNEGSSSVSLLLNNGDSTFADAREFFVGQRPVSVVVADFTGDGLLDLAVASFDFDQVNVLLGAAGAVFGSRIDIPAGDEPVALAGGDFNRDGRRDLAVANQAANLLSVILNRTELVPGLADTFVPQTLPQPGFQFEDVGLKVRAVPRMHPGGEVTLQLTVELKNLLGQSVNQIPIISNRTLEQTVRLREDEATIVGGILTEDVQRSTSGWPILARAPVAGHAAGRKNRQVRESELLIVLTPRRLRLQPRIGRTLFAGREPVSSGAAPAGAPPQPGQPQPGQPPPTQRPPQTPPETPPPPPPRPPQ